MTFWPPLPFRRSAPGCEKKKTGHATVKNQSFPGSANQPPPSHPACRESELFFYSAASFQGPLHHFYIHLRGGVLYRKVHTLILSLTLTCTPGPAARVCLCWEPSWFPPALPALRRARQQRERGKPHPSCRSTSAAGTAAHWAREQLNGFLCRAYLPCNRTIISQQLIPSIETFE